MIRLFQMYLQYGVFLWLPGRVLLFGSSKCIYSMVYSIGFPGRVCYSVIPNVFTVWCISLASQVEFGDSVFQMYLQYGVFLRLSR